ncbi:MAG: orotidine-5'-phosphate decarboxylase [Gammaproteobacteria bacterium]|uniref:Orotidine 5'-phosphate decarboxylase n=1 Tax=Candidatus Thiopontia autotrophica TaxID=2841688 RepID=A0A8J6P408_9GAMM|nr:orotidine-5'-phosphate decarboxylase [Candidatus Thiopontia autotrophica]MBL6968712.1 orotidine-5'-phosphate decarboxylase [Gammaproteobacteria bacterium]
MANQSKVVVALDFPDAGKALDLAGQLDPAECRVKVGKELFTRSGPRSVEQLVTMGFDVFLDLKYHDIPNTVASACRAAADLGVWMVNVHASGGRKMMEAARDALSSRESAPLLIAVTVLTSMDRGDLAETGLDIDPANQVLRLATLAEESGMDGVVCSPREISLLRGSLRDDFCLITPGIRPAGSARGDQKRVMTPAEAVALGSNWLVIGRPITAAEDPLAALHAINTTLLP